MTAEQNFAELYRVARAAGAGVAAQHAGFVTADDMTQEAVLWLLEHPRRVAHHRLPTGELHFNLLVAEVVSRHLSPLAQLERAEVTGGSLEDRYTYSVKVVELVLPAVFDPNFEPPLVPDGQPRAANDPSEGNNWRALVLDVTRAVSKVCSVEDKRVLFTRSVGGWTWARFGEAYTQSGESFRRRYKDALQRVAAHLNDGVVVYEIGRAHV